MNLTNAFRLLMSVFLFAVGGAVAASHSSPGHHGLEREHNLVLAQMAVGQGIETNLSLLNVVDPQRVGPNGTPMTTGTVHFFAQDGSSLPVRINGGAPTTEYDFSLDPFEMVWLLLTSDGPTTPGWILIDVDQSSSDDDGSDDNSSSSMQGPGPRNGDDGGSSDSNDDFERGERLLATAYFTTLDDQGAMLSRVGVIPSKFVDDDFYTTVVAAQFSAGVNTGAAIVNTGGSSKTVQLRLRDTQGNLVASSPLTLQAGHQTARFIDELFQGVPEGFQGFFEIDADSSGIITLGLLQTDRILTSLPTRHYGQGSSM